MNSKQLAPSQLSLAPWADPEIMWIPSVCFIHFFHLSDRGEGLDDTKGDVREHLAWLGDVGTAVNEGLPVLHNDH